MNKNSKTILSILIIICFEQISLSGYRISFDTKYYARQVLSIRNFTYSCLKCLTCQYTQNILLKVCSVLNCRRETVASNVCTPVLCNILPPLLVILGLSIYCVLTMMC